MAFFDDIFNDILKHEGTEYTDFAEDKGGATKFGVTLALLRAYMPSADKDDVENLSQDQAREIYQRLWDEARISRLDLDQVSGEYYFDMYINGGGKMAGMVLQAAINHKLSATDSSRWIDVDGLPGNGTRQALTRVGGISRLDLMIQRSGFFWNNVLKGCRYAFQVRDGVSNRTDQELFIYGWIRRCFGLDSQGRTSISRFSRSELEQELEARQNGQES